MAGYVSAWGPDVLVGRTGLPVTKMVKTAHGYTISMDLPEMAKENIRVQVSGTALRVSGGGFQRALRIPEGVGAEDVTAAFRGGVLNLTVPDQGDADSSGGEVEVG